MKPAVVAGLYLMGVSSAWAQTPDQPAGPAGAPAAPVQAVAGDPPDPILLKDIVVTASRREQAIREAPASISVIGRDEIEAKPYTSVAEIVNNVEGGERRRRVAERPGHLDPRDARRIHVAAGRRPPPEHP
ncbi:hypothetical protein LGN19_11600 [Burkholderia sp. AU30198]|uniref:hypothetical protein n=1 Tax=Burkholderia sp. AU30198 TaxID=2879627 RepID=UPI001CF5F7EC|nr:hypothetical protein [Burkholderia sp. AU30198]MCA8294438.1 hypothetical protein [Burkholderia sp. AU30198]